MKKQIGKPIIFPDGIGTNYRKVFVNSDNSKSTSTLLTPAASRLASESQLEASSSSQSSRSISFIHSPVHQASHSKPNESPSCPQPGGEQSFIDIRSIENIRLDGTFVFLRQLSAPVTEKELEKFLRNTGFTAPKILRPNNELISLEFSHSYIASAAFSILRLHFWGSSSVANSSLSLRPRTTSSPLQTEIIDLTEIEESDEFTVDSDRECTESSHSNTISCVASFSPSLRLGRSDSAHLTSRESEVISDGSVVDIPRTLEQPRVVNVIDILSSSRPSKGNEDKKIGICVADLPDAPHNRARRILLPLDSCLPFLTVSMRSDIHYFHRTERHRISAFSIPNSAAHRHTVDAVMVGDTPVIGNGAGPSQVSLVRTIEGRPTLIDLTSTAHIERNTVTSRKYVSCLVGKNATANAIRFFTGGHDKTIRLWSVETLDNKTETEMLTSLQTTPEALAFRDHSLLVGTSKKILTLDLGHLSASPTTALFSNAIHNIHRHKQARNITIVEVDNQDLQILIFDDRIKRGFDRTSDCSFGRRCQGTTYTRYSRGDADYCLFAKGYPDGFVRVWDFRNAKQPVITKSYENMGIVMHTVFADPNTLLCYSDEKLAFVNLDIP